MSDRPEPFAVTLRTPAERTAFDAGTAYAATTDLATPPEMPYLQALPAARSVILRRLLRGLYRGTPDGIPDPDVQPRTDASGAIERLLPGAIDSLSLPANCDRVVLFPFPDSEAVVTAPVVGIYGYDRLRLGGPIRNHTVDESTTITHPIDVVSHLREAGAFCDREQADRIERELAESTANLALARVARRSHEAVFDSTDTVLDRGLAAAERPAGLERLVTDGHPLHPSAKIRRGMSPTEALSYAPEFTDSIAVRFVAVHIDRAREPSIDDRSLTDRLSETVDGLPGAVDRAVPGDAAAYAVVPVHPWQFHHEIPDRYASQRREGTVVPIPDVEQPATPLLNHRTVVPDSDGDRPPLHYKLAIGVQLTNVERTVSPQAAHNGPRVTRLLQEIAAEEEFSRLGFVPEPASTCFYPPDGPHLDGQPYHDVRHLSALVRSNPRSHLLVSEDTQVVPAATLVADSPVSNSQERAGTPLVREAIDRYADATDTTDLADAARGFVDAYVDAVVPAQLRLLSTYGIALESHLQNSAIVFEDGIPAATLVRDFGGIRVHQDRLARQGHAIDIYPDSDLVADGERDLHWKLYYALFQNHLTELIVAIVDSTPIDPADCWRLVRQHSRSAFETVRRSERVPVAQIDRDERALFAEPATHKALVAMRLKGKRHEYVTSEVSNPIVRSIDGETFDRR